MRASLWTLSLIAALSLGCGSKSSSGSLPNLNPQEDGGSLIAPQGQGQGPRNTAKPRLKSPQDVVHSAECLVNYYDENGRLQQSYREEVISDGASRFSLKPLESLIDMPADWEHRKRIREGYAFRYGSFDIRDEWLMSQNFIIEATGRIERIAGRQCQLYSITPRTGPGQSYEVWADPVSGLALRSERRDAKGTLRFSRLHESLNLAPVLERAIWFQSVHDETPLDLSTSLVKQMELPVHVPRLLPKGYAIQDAYRLTQAGRPWIKLVYSNGIEPLFMLQRPNPPKEKNPGGGRFDDKLGSLNPQPSLTDTRLHVLSLDGVTGVHTEQPEGTFEVVGIVDEQELVDMISSALPN